MTNQSNLRVQQSQKQNEVAIQSNSGCDGQEDVQIVADRPNTVKRVPTAKLIADDADENEDDDDEDDDKLIGELMRERRSKEIQRSVNERREKAMQNTMTYNNYNKSAAPTKEAAD